MAYPLILFGFQGMSGRVSQARKYFWFSQTLSLTKYIALSVGLNIDCSPWVKAGLISHDDMLDRNWAHWTTFCQVSSPWFANDDQSSNIVGIGRVLVLICWPRTLRL